jgi:hypothetical protein
VQIYGVYYKVGEYFLSCKKGKSMKKAGLLCVFMLIKASELPQKRIECMMSLMGVFQDNSQVITTGPWPEKQNYYQCGAVVSPFASHEYLENSSAPLEMIAAVTAFIRTDFNRFFSSVSRISSKKVRGYLEVLPHEVHHQMITEFPEVSKRAGCSLSLIVANLHQREVLCAHLGEGSIVGFEPDGDLAFQSIAHDINEESEESRLIEHIENTENIQTFGGKEVINNKDIMTTASRWLGATRLCEGLNPKETFLKALHKPTITTLSYGSSYGLLLGRSSTVKQLIAHAGVFFKNCMDKQTPIQAIGQQCIENPDLHSSLLQGAVVLCALRQIQNDDCTIL